MFLQLLRQVHVFDQGENFSWPIEFRKLNDKHREILVKARTKEVQSLLDNKAIRILSLEESNKFRKEFPDHILPSRYVDRWKPTGDKFSVLPENFDEAGFEPMNDSGLAAKSRWCVVGWKDPLIHACTNTFVNINLFVFPTFCYQAMERQSERCRDSIFAVAASHPEEQTGLHDAVGLEFSRLHRWPIGTFGNRSLWVS